MYIDRHQGRVEILHVVVADSLFEEIHSNDMEGTIDRSTCSFC